VGQKKEGWEGHHSGRTLAKVKRPSADEGKRTPKGHMGKEIGRRYDGPALPSLDPPELILDFFQV